LLPWNGVLVTPSSDGIKGGYLLSTFHLPFYNSQRNIDPGINMFLDLQEVRFLSDAS
jgi:hypothetical protein